MSLTTLRARMHRMDFDVAGQENTSQPFDERRELGALPKVSLGRRNNGGLTAWPPGRSDRGALQGRVTVDGPVRDARGPVEDSGPDIRGQGQMAVAVLDDTAVEANPAR